MKNKTQWIIGGLAVLLVAIVGVYFANPSLQQGKVFKLPIVRLGDFEIIRSSNGSDLFGDADNPLGANFIFRDKNNAYDPTQPGGPQPKVKLSRLLWITPAPGSSLPPGFSSGAFTGGPFPLEVNAVPSSYSGEPVWRVPRDTASQIIAATGRRLDSFGRYPYDLKVVFGFKVGSQIACGTIQHSLLNGTPLGLYGINPSERPLCNQLVFDRD